jgi:hypothetical protein
LSLVERPEARSLQFNRGSHMQGIERPHADARRVTLSELCANFQGAIGKGSVSPDMLGAVLLKPLDQTVGLAPRNRFSKDVLFNSMGPFRYMERCHP